MNLDDVRFLGTIKEIKEMEGVLKELPIKNRLDSGSPFLVEFGYVEGSRAVIIYPSNDNVKGAYVPKEVSNIFAEDSQVSFQYNNYDFIMKYTPKNKIPQKNK